MKTRRFYPLVIALTLLSTPARAWDQKGHRVVAAVAWDHMDSETRTKAVALLRGAPGDSDLLAEDAGSALPEGARDRELFLQASTWPDIVRATNHPARRRKYHQGPWHYVNIFWQERGRKAVERKDLGMEGKLIEQLGKCDTALRAVNSGGTPEPLSPALALAWYEHLVGDVHAPLHASGRVTPFEKRGDHGGNDFCLGKTHALGKHNCSSNLHEVRDHILVTQRGADSVEVVAADLHARYGKPLFIGLGNYEGWARESYKLATTKVYPPTLFRRVKPTAAYYSTALKEAEPRLALAGYRLGEGLNALLK